MAQCGCACVVTLLGDAPELVNGNELDFQTFTRLSTDSKVEQIEDSHLRVGHIGCLSFCIRLLLHEQLWKVIRN